MKNGLLVCSHTGTRKNIGDYIQSVAQEQYLDHVDLFIDRENLKYYSFDESVNLIMNGWFMWKPQSFPPSECFNPLFISFHIVPKVAEELLSEETIEYLKRHEPIGTRDTGTKDILDSKGVDCYFSGCLTTTLNLKFSRPLERKGGVVFVDPYYSIAGTRASLFDLKGYFKDLYCFFKNYRKVNCFIDAFQHEYWTWYGRISRRIEKRVCASVFYESYSRLCSDEVLFSAQYITHNIPSSRYNSEEEWLQAAKDLICLYTQADYVITSRIHCALPCLGIETPVIFILSDSLQTGKLRSRGRFGGLLSMLNVLLFGKKITPLSESMSSLLLSGKLTLNSHFSNPNDYKSYRDDMIERVQSFIKTACKNE